jgi:hypothetical protein
MVAGPELRVVGLVKQLLLLLLLLLVMMEAVPGLPLQPSAPAAEPKSQDRCWPVGCMRTHPHLWPAV